MNCSHPDLVRIENYEFGGEHSTTYQCRKCNELFTVSIAPLADPAIVWGTSSSQKVTQ